MISQAHAALVTHSSQTLSSAHGVAKDNYVYADPLWLVIAVVLGVFLTVAGVYWINRPDKDDNERRSRRKK